MELMEKQGYKQTEVGLIPEDWNFVKIQSLMDNNIIVSHLDGNHGALYPRSSEFTDNGVPYITANDFLKGIVNFNNVRYLPILRAEQFQKGIAKNGDVLFAHNATVGPTAVLETDLNYVILSTTATYFRTDNKKLNNFYLRYFFESEFFVKQYSAVMRQSTRNQIPITQQRKFSVILPSTLEEQKAIATALSDADELINNLDKLIAKKKAIKQGAMQQLLTPPHKEGKRLAGFSGEWEEKKLGEFIRFQTGFPFSSEYFETKNIGDGIRLIKNRDLRSDDSIVYYLGTYLNDFIVHNGELLIGMDGDFEPVLWKKGKALLNQRVGRILSYKKISIQYLSYALLVVLKEIELRTGSTTVKHLSHSDIENLYMYLPEVKEQNSIAEILTDMDMEIELLEAKKAKYNSIKQGMMQELLTGKTRLI